MIANNTAGQNEIVQKSEIVGAYDKSQKVVVRSKMTYLAFFENDAIELSRFQTNFL